MQSIFVQNELYEEKKNCKTFRDGSFSQNLRPKKSTDAEGYIEFKNEFYKIEGFGINFCFEKTFNETSYWS